MTIFCDILPIYDNILDLHVQKNRIESLEVLADKIADMPSHSSCFNTITNLNLTGNPVLTKLRDNNNNNNTNERAALLTILSRFKRIHSIEANPNSLSSYGPEIESALRFNHAGRIIVEGNNNVDHSHGDDDATEDGDGGKKRQVTRSNNGTQNNSSVPLSVWSKVLERSYKKSPPTSTTAATSTVTTNNGNGESNIKDATGLYYLVRNGPIIGAIVANQQRQLNVVADKYTYDNGLQEETEGEKRKRTSTLSSPSSSSKSYPLKRTDNSVVVNEYSKYQFRFYAHK